jgi:inositol transport system substrate-binding protein
MFQHTIKPVILAAVMLCSISTAAAAEKIVASFHNMAEPFYVTMQRELRDEAKKLGVKVFIVDARANSAKQTADVENALVQNVQGIILAPTDIKALAPVADEVIKNNIPLITVDRHVTGTRHPVPHVGADNVAGGRKIVEWVVKQYPEGAKVILITGQPGSSSAIDRTLGIKQALDKAGPTYTVIAEQTANWMRNQALSVTQNLLTALGDDHPDVIICENDDMALGALEALRQAGMTNMGIKITGWDALPEVLQYIKSGELAATVEQSPSRQIRTALRELVEYIRNKNPVRSSNIDPVLITRDNLDAAERLSEVK